jgi:hypothetical protein
MMTAGAMNTQAIRVCRHATRRSRERASLRISGLGRVAADGAISVPDRKEAGRAVGVAGRVEIYLLAQ